MVSELKHNLASYRLLYFQPDPEDGERTAVAILVYHGRDVDVIYDKKFPKVRCLAPAIDPDLLGFFLDDLKRSLTDIDSNISDRLRSRSPQLVASAERKLAWPLSDKAKLQLIERFLHPKHKSDLLSLKSVAGLEHRQELSKRRLSELVTQFKSPNILAIKEDATPAWIVGHKIPKIAPVALAVRKPNVVLLLDGIDLNVLTPGAALSRVNKIVHTFWQYGRFRQQGLDHASLHRIGVVMNGVSRPSPAASDTHDFALDQFSKEAEFAIDASSPSGRDKLRSVLD